ncbi:hypothetical protein [Trebonia sp.]|nr:hypothetical protein [Trebonia sp.]
MIDDWRKDGTRRAKAALIGDHGADRRRRDAARRACLPTAMGSLA